MMGAIALPSQVDVDTAYRLLSIVADPVKAKALLDQIVAAMEKLKEGQKALDARNAELTEGGKILEEREGTVAVREADALKAMQAGQRAEAKFAAERQAAEVAAATAKRQFDEAVEVAKQQMAEQQAVIDAGRRDLGALMADLDAREAALKEGTAAQARAAKSFAAREAKIAEVEAEMLARRDKLAAALAAA